VKLWGEGVFGKSLKSISILFKYAPGLTLIKLFQIVLSAVLAPLSIYFTQRIIDTVSGVVINGESWGSLSLWAGLLVFSMFFSSVGGGFLNGILYIAIKRRLNIGMTPDILEKFKRLDYTCFEDKDVQDTLKRMSSDPQDKVFQLFLTITGVLECVIGVIGAALIFAQAGWWFAAGFVVLLLPMIWLDFKAADMMNTMFNNQSTDERMLYYLGGLLSNKSSLFELKIFRAADYISKKWHNLAYSVLNTRVKTTMHSQKYFLFSTILFKCWSFFIVLSLAASVIKGNITIGLFAALIASTGSVLDNAGMLSHTVQNLRARYLLMEHYYKFMSLPEIQDGGERLTDDTPHIIFENVSFTYPKTDKKILKGVSFEVKQGERIALVGENGAGKSTIIKLLCRLYKPDSGRILMNGQDIQTLDASALKCVFSVVFQDFCKYTLTLRENVAFGDLSKLQDDDALLCALRLGLAGDIAQLDTPLGKLEEGGVDLSVGQWQRIAIARACLPDSAFVILDEPTASLDPLAESEMYHSFAEVLKNRGCIVISHRLASARMADRIIVLSDGIVIESGSHSELMHSGGLYAQMYQAQSGWYRPDKPAASGGVSA
jgi:ABC-type multidrug transport system fused ATPase/permease subunit